MRAFSTKNIEPAIPTIELILQSANEMARLAQRGDFDGASAASEKLIDLLIEVDLDMLKRAGMDFKHLYNAVSYGSEALTLTFREDLG